MNQFIVYPFNPSIELGFSSELKKFSVGPKKEKEGVGRSVKGREGGLAAGEERRMKSGSHRDQGRPEMPKKVIVT